MQFGGDETVVGGASDAIGSGWVGGHNQNLGKAVCVGASPLHLLNLAPPGVEVLHLKLHAHPRASCVGLVFVASGASSLCAAPWRTEEKMFAESCRRRTGALPCGLSGLVDRVPSNEYEKDGHGADENVKKEEIGHGVVSRGRSRCERSEAL